jgi:hypothetical protein
MNRVLSLALVALVVVSGGLAQTQITSPPMVFALRAKLTSSG